MITCLGLIVGVVENASRTDVLRQCAKFLQSHKYLIGISVEFEIDRQVYATVLDTHNFDDGFGVLFKMYDGRTTIAMAE